MQQLYCNAQIEKFKLPKRPAKSAHRRAIKQLDVKNVNDTATSNLVQTVTPIRINPMFKNSMRPQNPQEMTRPKPILKMNGREPTLSTELPTTDHSQVDREHKTQPLTATELSRRAPLNGIRRAYRCHYTSFNTQPYDTVNIQVTPAHD